MGTFRVLSLTTKIATLSFNALYYVLVKILPILQTDSRSGFPKRKSKYHMKLHSVNVFHNFLQQSLISKLNLTFLIV